MTIAAIKNTARLAGVSLRELGARSGVVYSRISDAFNGWVQLKEPEIEAIDKALQNAIRDRVEKLNKLAGRKSRNEQG